MKPLHQTDRVRLYHCEHAALATHMRDAGEQIDALIVDAPYSSVTHNDSKAGLRDPSTMSDPARVGRSLKEGGGLDYDPWSPADVRSFCDAWVPPTRGWIVSITDWRLAAPWVSELERLGRYVFAPLAIYEPGSRVRLSGDGPSTWVTWLIVARPTTRAFQRWGTLPGGYTPALERKPIVGGKAINLMRSIVRDYSRPGDLVCDPCCGAGSTLIAALAEGRRAIGCDRDEAHAEMARRQLSGLPANADPKQLELGGGA